MEENLTFPDPPERPLDSDCCGQGCTPCVLDIYEDELRLWEAECERIGSGETAQEANQVCPLNSDTYSSFKIARVSKESCDTLRMKCSLRFSQTLGLSLGQHIIIRVKTQNGSYITRQFTPVSPLDANGFFELIVKIYPTGRFSQVAKTWIVGDQIEARGPAGGLAYKRNKYRRVLMLCAGTGIAPMCQVIHSVLADEQDETILRLVYACRTYDDLLAKQEIDEWRRFWNFSALFVLSQEPESEERTKIYQYGEEIQRVRIDKSLLCKELPGESCNTTFVLICGPRSFDSDLLSYITELGVSQTNLHKF